MNLAVRVIAAHWRTACAFAAGVAAYAALLPVLGEPSRVIVAWDAFGTVFLGLVAVLMLQSTPGQMPANARAQEDGEWVIFAVVVFATTMSFAALIGEFSGTKDMEPAARHRHVALVVATLALSWLVTQIVFALRYAHEYYGATGGTLDKGLDFPGGQDPDYWDFAYFAIVLGMTFQVSDVQITSRKLRRLATVHGLLGFLFNTVIVALTVNLAANLL